MSIILCILLLIAIVAGIVALISWQVSDIASDATKIQERVTQTTTELKQYISNTLGISPEKQKQMLEKQQEGSPGKVGAIVASVLSSFAGMLANALLVLIYIFLFMYFRGHLKNFILKLVPEANKKRQ